MPIRLPSLLTAASTLALLARSTATYTAPARADLRPSLDSFVTRRFAADSFSGVVLVAQQGHEVYERASGLANRETGAAMTVDTKLQIASTTKLFTQIAIRQLEQAGKLALSDTVGKFLPAYPNPRVRSRVTVEQLLQHRSGVGSFWNERFIARHAEVRSVDDYLALFEGDSLLFEPGTSEAYSNGGYVLLGAIIERVSGQSYHDYLREHVFRPAGMTRTQPFDRLMPAENAAVGYTSQPLGGAATGDRRLAGSGARPGYEPDPTGAGAPATRRPRDSTATTDVIRPGGAVPERRLRIVGPDGRELSPEEARAAMTQRAASRSAARRPNSSLQPGLSGPAGDHYSTVGDFLKLAQALVSHTLLDSTHTAQVLGPRYATAGEFRANGGGPGVNAEFSLFASGDIMVVLSNYDPPAATVVAQYIRGLLGAERR